MRNPLALASMALALSVAPLHADDAAEPPAKTMPKVTIQKALQFTEGDEAPLTLGLYLPTE